MGIRVTLKKKEFEILERKKMSKFSWWHTDVSSIPALRFLFSFYLALTKPIQKIHVLFLNEIHL